MTRPNEIDAGHRMKNKQLPGDVQSVFLFFFQGHAQLTFGRRMVALVPTNRLTGWMSNVDRFIACSDALIAEL